MSTYTVKSTVIANRDAVPGPNAIFTDAYVDGSPVCESEGYIQTYGSSDGANSLYKLCQVPSNARMSALVFQADSLGSGAALDVGVYWPTFIPMGAGLTASNAGTAINTQLFASALGCSAKTAITDILNSSGNNSISNQELPLWSAAGLTSDPGILLDIVVHVQTAIATQGYIGLKARFVKQ